MLRHGLALGFLLLLPGGKLQGVLLRRLLMMGELLLLLGVVQLAAGFVAAVPASLPPAPHGGGAGVFE